MPPTLNAKEQSHPGGNPGANLKSISHRCYLFEVAFVWELTTETIDLPLGCPQGGPEVVAGEPRWDTQAPTCSLVTALSLTLLSLDS